MIYLGNTTSAQSVRFPSNGLTPSGATIRLTFTNTATRKVMHTQDFAQFAEADGYYNLPVALTAEMPNGEYEYRITAYALTIGEGLAQVGEYSRRMTEGTAAFELKQAK